MSVSTSTERTYMCLQKGVYRKVSTERRLQKGHSLTLAIARAAQVARRFVMSIVINYS